MYLYIRDLFCTEYLSGGQRDLVIVLMVFSATSNNQLDLSG